MNVTTWSNYEGNSSATRNKNPLAKVIGMENKQEYGGMCYFQAEKSKHNQALLATSQMKLQDLEKSNSMEIWENLQMTAIKTTQKFKREWSSRKYFLKACNGCISHLS